MERTEIVPLREDASHSRDAWQGAHLRADRASYAWDRVNVRWAHSAVGRERTGRARTVQSRAMVPTRRSAVSRLHLLGVSPRRPRPDLFVLRDDGPELCRVADSRQRGCEDHRPNSVPRSPYAVEQPLMLSWMPPQTELSGTSQDLSTMV